MKMDEKTAKVLAESIDDVFKAIDGVNERLENIDMEDAASDVGSAIDEARDAEKSAGAAYSVAEDAQEKLNEIEKEIDDIKEQVDEIGSKMRTLVRALEPFLPKTPIEVLQKFCKDHRSTLRGMYLDNYTDRGPFNGIVISITRLSEMLGVTIDLDEIERRKLEEITEDLSKQA